MACYSWLKISEDGEDTYSQDEALGCLLCAIAALSRPLMRLLHLSCYP